VRIFVHAEFLSTKILNLSTNYLKNSLCVHINKIWAYAFFDLSIKIYLKPYKAAVFEMVWLS